MKIQKKISRKTKKDFPKPISIHKHFAYTVHFNDGRKSIGKNNENKQCSKKTFFRSREPNVYSFIFIKKYPRLKKKQIKFSHRLFILFYLPSIYRGKGVLNLHYINSVEYCIQQDIRPSE